MVESAPAVSSLLSSCTTCDPPFQSLINETLSSLDTSLFHFALQLQQTLDSSRDNLEPLQIICILCAIYCIGDSSGSSKGNKDDSNKIQTNQNRVNAFSGFLERYHKDALSIMEDVNDEANRKGKQPLSLPLLKEQKENTTDADTDADAEDHAQNEDKNSETDAPNQNNRTPSMPEFLRPLPPLSNITNCGEPLNLNMQFIHMHFPSLRYEWLQPEDPKPSTEELLDKIFHAPLDHEEERALLLYCRQKGIVPSTGTTSSSGISKDSQEGQSRAREPLLTPENLPELVQHNPNVAIILLLSLKPSTAQTQLYHSALVHMDITLHTMEVVYKLATNNQLRTKDLHIFVLALFERCTKIEGGGTATGPGSGNAADQGLGAGSVSVSVIRNDRKMVRLVCVFLQNLISNGFIKVEDFVEIQAFCIENSRLREANALFKLIKDMIGKSSRGGNDRNSKGTRSGKTKTEKGAKSGRR